MLFDVRIACDADAQEIATLVNRAYRPSLWDDRGWTHEASLIAGERTTAEQVYSLLRGKSVVLVLCFGPKIVACVHVQGSQFGACIGMLATDPKMQNQGLGKTMLHYAEAYAVEHFEASVLKISVLSSRPELLAFYERKGYFLNGSVEEYPVSASVGEPIVTGIQVLSLTKVPTKS